MIKELACLGQQPVPGLLPASHQSPPPILVHLRSHLTSQIRKTRNQPLAYIIKQYIKQASNTWVKHTKNIQELK